MEIKTKRLLLRPWREEDAERLYRLCRVPEIGDGAGFPPHESAEVSRAVIRGVLSQPETYAIVSRGSGEIIGSCGLILSLEGSACKKPGDAEVGYWIGKPYWGWGFATEALGALAARAADGLGLRGLWGTIFPDNVGSRRVLEKAGFSFHHREDSFLAQLGKTRELLFFYRTLSPGDDARLPAGDTTATRHPADGPRRGEPNGQNHSPA